MCNISASLEVHLSVGYIITESPSLVTHARTHTHTHNPPSLLRLPLLPRSAIKANLNPTLNTESLQLPLTLTIASKVSGSI